MRKGVRPRANGFGRHFYCFVRGERLLLRQSGLLYKFETDRPNNRRADHHEADYRGYNPEHWPSTWPASRRSWDRRRPSAWHSARLQHCIQRLPVVHSLRPDQFRPSELPG